MIVLKNVTFSYAGDESCGGVQNIDLTVKNGEFILLCGESGCGKTTLTRLINGLIPHYYEGELTGSVQIGGAEITRLPIYETAAFVGSVFQNPKTQFYTVDTTGEMAFGAENQGVPADEIIARIGAAVRDFHMEALLDRSLFQLSGGEKQKVACASVAVSGTPVLVLDEPSSNLDGRAIAELRRLLEIWKEQGKTVVIAEHRLHFLYSLADRIVYMKQGRIERIFGRKEMSSLSGRELAAMGLRPFSLADLTGTVPAAGQEEALTLSDFSFAYKRANEKALDISSLSVPKNAVIAVIGHNGAGKSTLARCLCGLEKRGTGTLSVDGEIWKTAARLKHCFMVMQDVNHQLFSESVLDEVLLAMEEEDEARANAVLAGLDLLSMKELHPLSLSGGEKQRVAIACAIASNRDILLFDEPTSGLDLRHMYEVATHLRQLRAAEKTLFLISHDLELILASCTHVLHLEKGKVKADYALDDMGVRRLKAFFLETETMETEAGAQKNNPAKVFSMVQSS